MSLSIAIPASTQRPDHLRNAINSVIAQDAASWTLVVVDDAPGEGRYRELVESVGDARVRYLRNDGDHGIGQAWNVCTSAVDGELYAILHADDELKPNYVRVMTDLARRFPDGAMYFCGAEIIDDSGERAFSLADFVKWFVQPRGRTIRLAGESALARLFTGDFIMCPTIVYRKSRLGARRFSTGLRFVLDIALIADVLFAGEAIYGTSAAAYRYRRHRDAATAVFNKTGYRFEEEIALHRHVAAQARRRGFRLAALAANVMLFVRLNLLYCAVTDALSGRWGGFRSKLKLFAQARTS
ncbi:MAG: hypothetical protein QOF71_819 [Candidatus Eremiobacteraeota bacterium]|nr:hypothetical protein [Candidatus Eremiobacteraeota bacterium]